MERDKRFDVLKGILIILVVIGHGGDGILHDILYLFHMPVFFMVSGYFIKESDIFNVSFCRKKITRLMIPYMVYSCIDLLVFKVAFSLNELSIVYIVKRVLCAIWGGRLQLGVYWFTTVLFFSTCIFVFLKTKLQKKSALYLVIVVLGIMAIAESYVADSFTLLRSVGLPFAVDSSLLAVVYIAIGYCGKSVIKKIADDTSRRSWILVIVSVALLFVFCYLNYSGNTTFWKMDMKRLEYRELLLAVLIPVLFGLVLLKVACIFSSIDWTKKVLEYVGKLSLPIMYLHPLLNQWQESAGYGIVLYVIIGVSLPIVFITIMIRIFPNSRKYLGA